MKKKEKGNVIIERNENVREMKILKELLKKYGMKERKYIIKMWKQRYES